MWLFGIDGFYSVVQHKAHRDTLLIRSRVRKDLERLRKYIPALRVFNDRQGACDYKYRAFVEKDVFAKAILAMVQDINYPNFKDCVKERLGQDRSNLYMQIWSLCIQKMQGSKFRALWNWFDGYRDNPGRDPWTDNADMGGRPFGDSYEIDEADYLDGEFAQVQKSIKA